MATKITTCPECDSIDIKDINPELKESAKAILITILAECINCGWQFSYKSATNFGHKRGILY